MGYQQVHILGSQDRNMEGVFKSLFWDPKFQSQIAGGPFTSLFPIILNHLPEPTAHSRAILSHAMKLDGKGKPKFSRNAPIATTRNSSMPNTSQGKMSRIFCRKRHQTPPEASVLQIQIQIQRISIPMKAGLNTFASLGLHTRLPVRSLSVLRIFGAAKQNRPVETNLTEAAEQNRPVETNLTWAAEQN